MVETDGVFINLQKTMINVSDAAGFNFSEQTCVQWVSVQNMGIFNYVIMYVCSLECKSLKGVVVL